MPTKGKAKNKDKPCGLPAFVVENSIEVILHFKSFKEIGILDNFLRDMEEDIKSAKLHVKHGKCNAAWL